MRSATTPRPRGCWPSTAWPSCARGRSKRSVEAGDALPDGHRDAALDRLLGEAHQLRGDWDEALACLGRAAGAAGTIDAGLAWRIGLIHHLRGHLDEAMAAYRRGRDDAGPSGDLALLHAWHASAHWLRGDADRCRTLAMQAHQVAVASGEDRALAAAHTVLAMLAALEGDRASNDAHYMRALDHAERAGDVLQVIRIRVNRGSRNLEEGAYEAAIAELDLAIRLADLGGFGAFRALALTNRGESRLRLGRLEEAIADLDAARLIYQRLASDDVAYPLMILGDVYRERGNAALARAAYEEAARRFDGRWATSRRSGPRSPALRACSPATTQTRRARSRTARWDTAPAWARPPLCSRSATSRWPPATARAPRRRRPGRRRRARPARSRPHGRGARARGPVGAERPRAPCGSRAGRRHLARARQPARRGSRAARPRPGAARRARRRRGARGRGAPARARRAPADGRGRPRAAAAAAVAIDALGRFRVLRDGAPVPRSAWRSRKARDLLKMLVARHGRPVSRDALIEALWPEEDPARCANRLSVALSTLRGVLDPERRFDADRFVRLERGRRVAGPRPRRGRPRGLPGRRRRASRCTTRAGRRRRTPACRPPRPPTPATCWRRTSTRTGPSRRASRRATCTSASPAAWPPMRARPATTTAPSASCCASSSATPTTRRHISRS